MTVLALWGIRSTSDIGEIVYNLIASGDLEKTPSDSRADFDNVFTSKRPCGATTSWCSTRWPEQMGPVSASLVRRRTACS